MRTRRMAILVAATVTSVLALVSTLAIADMEPGELRTFPYQGRLDVNGGAANGAHDFRFGLFSADNADASCLVAETPTSCGFWWEEHAGVPVYAGEFTLVLGEQSGVGDSVVAQPELYLGIAVREVGDPAFVLLAGKQRFRAVPFAARAAAAKHFSVSGRLVAGVIAPPYADWNSLGTGAGGAAIYNDSNGYKSLMIAGNNSAGGVRKVSVWDDLAVNGTASLTGGLSAGGDIIKRGTTGQVAVSDNFAFRDTTDSWLRLRTGPNSESYADLALQNLWIGGSITFAGALRHATSLAAHDGFWGGWTSWHYCPRNEYVCGYRIRMEGNQGSGDDTAMNSAQLACCPFGP